jgi:hypothetical protein
VVAISNLVVSGVVAVVAGYIAWRQWQTAHQKLRLELFDRRFTLYDSLQQLINEALSDSGYLLAKLGKYLTAVAPARFLLADDIDQYISGLLDKLGTLYQLRRDKHAANAATPDIDTKIAEVEEWLRTQRDVVVKLFRPYLNIIA